MSIRDWFYHRHYWGVPHRRVGDNRMIQICYECGREREVRMDLAVPEEPDEDVEQDVGVREEEDGKRLARSRIDCRAIASVQFM